jgi:MFS family permease
VLVGLGLWVRTKLAETPAFEKLAHDAPPPSIPLVELFRTSLRQTLAGTFAVIVCFAIYYLTTAFALGYGTKTLGYASRTFLSVQLIAILFMALGILLSGYAADRWNSRAVLLGGSVAAILVGVVMGPMFQSGSLAMIGLFLSLALLTMGFVYGPLAELLPTLFAPRVRYTGASIAFNVGGIIGGGFAPAVAQGLVDAGGVLFVGLYISAAALLTVIGLLSLRRT